MVEENKKSTRKPFLSCLPGAIGYGAMILLSWAWSYWSFGEMYFEGWWGAWVNRVFYLIPMLLVVGLTVLVIYHPKLGAWITVIFGVAATIFFWGDDFISGEFKLDQLVGLLFIGGGFVLFGFLFFAEAKRRKQLVIDGEKPPENWFKRHGLLLLLLSGCLVIAIGFSIYWLPKVLTRVDDGIRSARVIEGNGITLEWAPKGPGWNWQQDWGGYPSWRSVAQYGLEPIGFEGKEDRFPSQETMETYNLCLYLNDAGTALMEEPQDIWRMPTVDEIVRTLGRHGENAGCEWNGAEGQMTCEGTPDKCSPLWALDEAPIYLWAAEANPDDEREAYFVSHSGYVSTTYKSGGNPRHTYRCVREVDQ